MGTRSLWEVGVAANERRCMSCEFCDREEKDIEGLLVFPICCGGHGCGHRRLYGLIDENCKQVIPLSGFGGVTETSTVW